MEAWTIYRGFPGTSKAQTALEYCGWFPGLLEGGPHVECGWLQQFLVVLPLRLSRHQAIQRVEGSERQKYLLYRGQSNDNSCPKPDRATQRSSLDEIAVSKWRRELTRRSCLDEIWLWYPCWCWAVPVYIAGQVQPGPGDQAVLNYDWQLGREAVDAAGGEMLRMLHWGTPRASGWLAGSRRASSCAQMIMMMMMLLLPTGSHFSEKLTGFYWGREILLVVFSWRDGSQVIDPVELTFQGRSHHITPL